MQCPVDRTMRQLVFLLQLRHGCSGFVFAGHHRCLLQVNALFSHDHVPFSSPDEARTRAAIDLGAECLLVDTELLHD